MDRHSRLLGKPSDLSINDCAKRGDSLSDVTAKYNKSRGGSNVLPVVGKNDLIDGAINEENLLKYKHPRLLSSKVKPLSLDSSDGDSSDTEFDGLSLAGLVAKHKVSGSSCKVDSPVEMSNTSDSCSNTEGFLLHPVKSVQSQSSSQGVCGPLGTSSIETGHFRGLPELSFGQIEIITKIDNEEKEHTPNKQIALAYVPVNVSDDSESDESITLTKLTLRHSSSAGRVKTGSSNDFLQLKPRELAVVVNSHRQHTKSESDSFSTVAGMSSDNLKKSFYNETSTSLGSLRENVPSESDFQFSMGCSFPASYKPISRSKNCLISRKIKTSGCFSDPDVSRSTENTSNVRPFYKSPLVSGTGSGDLSVDVLDCAFEGINLSSAIKVSSSSRTSESTEVEEEDLNAVNDSEDEVIVTLLDNLCVEEEPNEVADKIITVISKTQEQCTLDASNILEVKLKHRTNKCSLFGKVVCRKWRLLHMPYIRKEKLRTSIIPFDFSTLSPDDEVLSLLKRRH